MLIVIPCMVILYLWPGMTLWLPAYLYGGFSARARLRAPIAIEPLAKIAACEHD